MFSYTTGWTVVRLAATGRLEAPDNPLFEDVAAWRPWQLAYTNSRKSVTAAFTTQIEIDGEGVAWIGGTRVKVIEVVLDKIAYGWSPEEIHFQHPPPDSGPNPRCSYLLLREPADARRGDQATADRSCRAFCSGFRPGFPPQVD